MNRLGHALAEVLQSLNALSVPCALVGGVAVSTRAEPRFTRDLDLAVAVPQDEDAERIVSALMSQHYQTIAVVEQVAVSRLATVRLKSPIEAGIVIDLLFASSGIEQEIVAVAEPIEVFVGVTVPVARVGHLVALKLLARDDQNRPQDAWDLRVLSPLLDAEEERRARVAVRTIMDRGFARGRQLDVALDGLLANRRR
jgi:predicted nucleotidyltransferase